MTDPTPPVPLDPGPGPVDVTPPDVPPGIPGAQPSPVHVEPVSADVAALLEELVDGLAVLASLVERLEALVTLVPQVSTLFDRLRNLAAPPVLGDPAEAPPDPAGPVIHPDAQGTQVIRSLEHSVEALVQRAKDATDEKVRAPLLRRADEKRAHLARVIAGDKA